MRGVHDHDVLVGWHARRCLVWGNDCDFDPVSIRISYRSFAGYSR
jgi:hypothetical protein